MNDDKLPPTAFRFLKWFCPDHLYEEIEEICFKNLIVM
jgi:hypothetical protein